MIAEPRALAAVELFYQAVTEPDKWPAAMAATMDLFGCGHALLFTNKASSSDFPFGANAGLDAAGKAAFLAPSTAEQWRPWQQAVPPGRVVGLYEMISGSEFEKLAIYNEVIRPMGGYHALLAQIDTGALSFHLALCRGRTSGDYDEEEAAGVQHMLPHVTAALDLHRRLRFEQMRADGLAGLFNRLNEAVILTDTLGRPLFVSARAQELVDAADGLIIGSSGVKAANSIAAPKLRAAIRAAADSVGTRGLNLQVPRKHGSGMLELNVLPIRRLELAMPGEVPSSVAIFIKLPELPPSIDPAILAEMFELTPRESETAILLATGASTEAIAAALDLAVGTVRFNLKRIYEKTGVHSQSALVALLHRLGTSPPLP